MQIFISKDYICCCFVKGNSSIEGYSCLFQALIWTKRASVFWKLCTLIKNIQKKLSCCKTLKIGLNIKGVQNFISIFQKKQKQKQKASFLVISYALLF